ncbi:cyclic nucleotide-binding domain-containing protein [Actinomadura formosensis]|uniref:cyclic nucleotide-binding domain-containing protein n=1 Tax=Actinomadura formosensis TaxID=60706 RepID=UPI003D926E6A
MLASSDAAVPAGRRRHHGNDRSLREVEVGSGDDDQLTHVRGPGSLLGAASAIGRKPRSATANAITSAQVAVLPAEEFERFLLSQRSDIAFRLLRIFCERSTHADPQPL